MNFITFILSNRSNKLVANHLIQWERTKLDTEHKSSKFLLEIMTKVSNEGFIYIPKQSSPQLQCMTGVTSPHGQSVKRKCN
jgi:hypothetical protein